MSLTLLAICHGASTQDPSLNEVGLWSVSSPVLQGNAALFTGDQVQKLSKGSGRALAIPTLTGHGEPLRPSCFTAILLFYYTLHFLGFALVPLLLGGKLNCICPFLVSNPEVQSPWACISACSKSGPSGHTLWPQSHRFRSFTFPPFQLVLALSFPGYSPGPCCVGTKNQSFPASQSSPGRQRQVAVVLPSQTKAIKPSS